MVLMVLRTGRTQREVLSSPPFPVQPRLTSYNIAKPSTSIIRYHLLTIHKPRYRDEDPKWAG
jgi:hypothetical protein